MIRYSQQDPKWKNKQLGIGDYTIGQAGCLLTDFAMITETDPLTLNNKMVIHGGFTDSLINSYVLPSVFSNLYFEARIACPKTPAPIDQIDSALSAGEVVIVQIDTSPAPDIQSHWVILTSKIGKDYNMVDPWPLTDNPPATVLGRYGKGRTIEAVITYVYIIAGVEMGDEALATAPLVATEPPPVELSDKAFIDVKDLRGRFSPGKDSPVVIERLAYGKEFERLPDVSVIKDGFRWTHLGFWVAESTADGKESYVK